MIGICPLENVCGITTNQRNCNGKVRAHYKHICCVVIKALMFVYFWPQNSGVHGGVVKPQRRDPLSGEKLHHCVTLIWGPSFHCRSNRQHAACSFRKHRQTFSYFCYGTISFFSCQLFVPRPCMFTFQRLSTLWLIYRKISALFFQKRKDLVR